MKNILLAIFSAISISSFGQVWTDYQVDSMMTLMIPDSYKVRDTLGHRVITAAIDNGLILISIVPETSMNIESEEDLLKMYKGFTKEYIKSQQGQLIKEEIIDKSGLKMVRFSFRTEMAGDKQIRHCESVVVNGKMYSINFWEAESLTNEMAALREKLFLSLRFSSKPGLKNQMNYKPENDKEYNLGLLFGKITIALLIGLAIWFSRRGKNKRVSAKLPGR